MFMYKYEEQTLPLHGQNNPYKHWIIVFQWTHKGGLFRVGAMELDLE
jgi:hypothetical protein